MASPIPVQSPVKNTFIHFEIDRFDIKARKRSASAPPRCFFLEEAGACSKAKKQKRNAPSASKTKKIDEDAMFAEFAQLARAESWAFLGKRLIERQARIEQRWDHLKCTLLQEAPNRKKKRFTLTNSLGVIILE